MRKPYNQQTKMNSDLEPAKAVLRKFLAELEKVKDIQRGISAPRVAAAFSVADKMPIFDPTEMVPAPDSFFEKEEAYIWLYGATRYHLLMHRMVTTRPMLPFYSQPVQPLFDKWLLLFLDVQNIDSYRIPDPMVKETLHAYLGRLQSIVIDQRERRKIWWQSLRSFTHFLRETARRQIEDLGELDVLFPEDMTIYFDSIIRKVPITLYPIDIWTAADVLKHLTQLVLEGRSNLQESAAQALGLAWVCLASGHARFMTRLEILIGALLHNACTGSVAA